MRNGVLMFMMLFGFILIFCPAWFRPFSGRHRVNTGKPRKRPEDRRKEKPLEETEGSYLRSDICNTGHLIP